MHHRLLHGRTALITGVTGGIGHAVAVALATAGASLVITDRNPGQLTTAATRLREHGALVNTITADLTRPGTARSLINECTDYLEHLDIIINAAGICRAIAPDRLTGPLWRETLAVDFEIPAQICVAAAPI